MCDGVTRVPHAFLLVPYRPHIKGRTVQASDRSTANAIFFLLFDMASTGNSDWVQDGWDWREWLDSKWDKFGRAYTRGTLTGRMSGVRRQAHTLVVT